MLPSERGSFEKWHTISRTSTICGSVTTTELFLPDGNNRGIEQEPVHKLGKKSKQAETVISDSNRQWLWRIAIHLLPLTAGAVITAVNLRGYFVGAEFAGVVGTKTQPIALLALQITAKLFEVLVVISLGFIVLQVVHHFLLFDDSGLPLALSGISLTFNNIIHLLRPSYWSGITLLSSWKIRISVGLLLLSCALIANLIGPSIALLLVPSYTHEWPAGGFRFRVPFSMEQLFPMELNASHTGPSKCMDPVESRVHDPYLHDFECLWYNVASIFGRISETNGLQGNYTVFDQPIGSDSVDRSISWATTFTSNYTWTAWFWSSTSLANGISTYLSHYWEMAAPKVLSDNSPPSKVQNYSWSDLSEYHRYAYRDPTGTRVKLPMLGPIVRTACKARYAEFNNPTTLPYRVKTSVDGPVWNVSTSLFQNISQVMMQWIPKPVAVSSGYPVMLDNQTYMPSALMVVQVPGNSTNIGGIFSCSIEARWANLTLTNGPEFNEGYIWTNGLPLTFGGTKDTFLDNQGLLLGSSTTQQIQLNLDWLNQLTPTFNTTGYTPLSVAIEQSGSLAFGLPDEEHLDSWLDSWRDHFDYLVSMAVVDGLARHNLFQVLGTHGIETKMANKTRYIPDWLAGAHKNPSALLAGADGTDRISDSSQYAYPEFVWTISISGYGYTIANNTASILAFAVLFIYMVLAISHIVFLCFKRWSSSIWDTIPEIVALCQNSPYSTILEKKVEKRSIYRTKQPLLKLRAQESLDGKGEKMVRVLVE